MSAQPIDLERETFTLYVPSPAPPQGYALIVFVPPWNGAKIPDGWEPVLDREGAIFVAATQSGNDTTALGRREPLALLAEYNVAKRYAVDPARVYVAGFSGGSRIAMRLALGYPDVFRGAILNSGSDPIGDAVIPLPPKDLFALFQSRSRLVYMTGSRDTFVLNADMASRRSMQAWCQFNVESRIMPSAGHETVDGAMLARALDLLAAPTETDANRLASCRVGIDADLAAKFAVAEQSLARGNRDAAKSALSEIDTQYGGLAAPRSLDLMKQVGQ